MRIASDLLPFRQPFCRVNLNPVVYLRSDRTNDHYIIFDRHTDLTLGTFSVNHADFYRAFDKYKFVSHAARACLNHEDARLHIENARIMGRALTPTLESDYQGEAA